jgi:hypothetical protein
LLGALELFSEFFADNRQLLRRFNADANAAVTDFDNGHGNLISDKNSFADFSTEYEHVLGLTARKKEGGMPKG